MMFNNDPIEVLHRALASAQYKDMPDVISQRRLAGSKPFVGDGHNKQQYEAWRKISYESYERRPMQYELAVVAMFPQIWGSTALGFGGMGGQAMTTAYTVVIECAENKSMCVYFDGHWAYCLPIDRCNMKAIEEDIKNRNVASVESHSSRYYKD
jgi:hypothetical protein